MADAMNGGDKLQAYLAKIAGNVAPSGVGPTVRVGFLEGKIYPDGTPVAYIAAIQEFGATIQRQTGSVTIYRKKSASGKFLRGGRFVKKSKATFTSTHAHGAYTITIPPRPFFRRMIAAKSQEWPAGVATQLKAKDYDGVAALDVVGAAIAGQLVESIKTLTDPPLAASTIRKKKFAKPLIDTGDMWRAVDHEVTTGETT
jgi:hypothetical protein